MPVRQISTLRPLVTMVVTAAALISACSAPEVRTVAPPADAAAVEIGPPGGVSADAIHIGMSAAFQGPSGGLGTELYRGSMAWFQHVNDTGGIAGRRIRVDAYDDGYDPTRAIDNTIRLVDRRDAFLLFDYVGTPTVTRVLPLLSRFADKHEYLFFPFTGAQPQREPPYAKYVFNLRASYRQETGGLV